MKLEKELEPKVIKALDKIISKKHYQKAAIWLEYLDRFGFDISDYLEIPEIKKLIITYRER